MKNTLLLKSYIALSLVYLLLILLGHENNAGYIRPFLIPFLILRIRFNSDSRSKTLLLTALTLSWFGDIIFLFADGNEVYFIAGLIAFLLSHIAYIMLFNTQIKPKNTKNKAVFWIGVTAIIMYLIVIIALLLPSLGDLTMPIFIYELVISTMLLFAFKGFLMWKKPANWYILTGAILLVSSDSFLVFNKFYHPLVLSSFFIMITYLIAQYLIVCGILKLIKKDSIL
jgi:uncharacterized membrane protein YhhN